MRARLPESTRTPPLIPAKARGAIGEQVTEARHGSKRLKWRSLAIVIALTAVYCGLLQLTEPAAGRIFAAIPAPHGAPDLWWKALQRLVPIGAADLIDALGPLWLYLAWRRRSWRDLGFGKAGTAVAWILVLAVQAAISWFQLRNPYGPLAHVKNALSPYALAGAAFAGIAASLAEETFFRGFIMDELRLGGFSALWQVVVSMLLFGSVHLSFASLDWTVPVLTGLLGGFWSVIYILAGRSLWPSMAAHFLNDALLVPSFFYFMVAHGLG
jgi:membrane protease YdiL (CAAX protease family)